MNLDDPLDQSRPSWKLYNKLLALGVSVDEAAALMDGYAHELAETIRNAPEAPEAWDDDFYRGLDAAADLIDPEVKQ
ncbi:hypothetical protein [Streptomyces sp. NPDC001492]